MIALISILFIALFVVLVLVPALRALHLEAEKKANKRYQDFKLYAVKKYHPAFRTGGVLSHLSYSEIRQAYRIDECYEQLGC